MPEQQTEALATAKPEEKQEMLARVTNFAPRTFDEAVRFAKIIAKATFCPPQLRDKPGDVFYVLQSGAELGIPPLQALSGTALINGRASLYGDLFLAVIQKHPDYEWHKERMEGQGETRVAICQFKRKGMEVHETRFSVDDAKRSQLWGKQGPWTLYPDRMLQMRSRGFCGRDRFADALKGMVIYEEALDTSPIQVAKPIEKGALDETALLVESKEPNRGHNQEGFAQNGGNGVSKPLAESKVPQPALDPETQPAAKETAKPSLVRGLVKVKDVEAKMKKVKGKDDQPYFLLIPTDPKAAPIYVWHQSLHEFAVKMKGREVDLDISRSDSQGKTFWSLENIYSVSDGQDVCKFVNNKPVLEEDTGAYAGQPTGDELFPPVHSDEG